MGLYKYVSNRDSRDGTAEIRLEGRDPVPMGGQVELNDEELALLSDRLNLQPVEGQAQGQGNVAGAVQAPVDRGGGEI
jgi:hypothetical protein